MGWFVCYLSVQNCDPVVKSIYYRAINSLYLLTHITRFELFNYYLLVITLFIKVTVI